MTRHRKSKQTVTEPTEQTEPSPANDAVVAETPQEPAGPVEEQSEPTQKVFYCFATGCPGYPYRADIQAHPPATCGSIVNCVHLNKDDTIAGLPEEKATNGEKIAEDHAERPLPLGKRLTEPMASCGRCSHNDRDFCDNGSRFEPILADLEDTTEPPAEIEPPAQTQPGGQVPEPEPAPTVETPEPAVFAPAIGTLWRHVAQDIEYLVEVCTTPSTQQADGQIAVMSYVPGSEGTEFGWVFENADFANGRLTPWEDLVPRWIADKLGEQAAALLSLDRVIERDEPNKVMPDTPALEELFPTEAPSTSGDLADSFGVRVNVLAAELGVRPEHVSRTIEAALDLFAQLVTFHGEIQSSPMVASLSERIREETSRDRGLIAGFVASFRPALAVMYRKTAEQFWVERADRLESWSREMEQMVGRCRVDVDRLTQKIDQASTFARSDAEEAVSTIAGSEITHIQERIDSATDRVFALESWRGLIQKEIGNFARSRKLQKHDPKSAADRGKEFRQRQKKLADEKARNLAALRKQKAQADAVEAGAKPRGRPKGKKRPAKGRSAVSDMAARNAVSAPVKRGRGRPPKVAAPPVKRGRGRPPKAPTEGGTRVQIRDFMGVDGDDRIMRLLMKVPPNNLGEFFKQAKHGIPDVKLHKWSPNEVGIFAKWYYGRVINGR
jgi:hypothetical protein